MKFLRYNSRHRLWFPRGYKGWVMPILDPIESSSCGKNGRRAFSINEPFWLFRLRQSLFCFAGKQKCGRRVESWMGETNDPLPDTWDIGPDGNRTCSYCGSIHPDDLIQICRKVESNPGYAIEGTTKSYKVYVRQPGVRNASEGAIKFYMAHAPLKPTEEEQKIFAKAVRISRERFEALYTEVV